MLRAGFIVLIGVYQRHISPHKGFTCAHLVLHGGVSCSQAVKLAIDEGGLTAGWLAAKVRAEGCRAAMIALQSEAADGEADAEHAGPTGGGRGRRMTGEDCCLVGAVEGCSACFPALFS